MPTKTSVQKAWRASRRKQGYNRPVSSAAKTFVSKAERLILANDLDSARVAVLEAVRALDKAARKGAIHSDNAARRKSRLMKKLNAAQALLTTSAQPQPQPAAGDTSPPENSQ